MQDLSAQLRQSLGTHIPICGCTGAAVVGTGPDGPVLVEDDSAVLSVSLAYFAGTCDVAVHHIGDRAAVPSLPQRDGEQQAIVLATPRSGGRINPVVSRMCRGAGKTVVFGGLASGRRANAHLFHSGGCHASGIAVCVLTPKDGGQQLDAVVRAPDTQRMSPPAAAPRPKTTHPPPPPRGGARGGGGGGGGRPQREAHAPRPPTTGAGRIATGRICHSRETQTE
eukprot:COSAG01_NODE_13300_length_1604_cov_10.776080_3_plen_224_part_00